MIDSIVLIRDDKDFWRVVESLAIFYDINLLEEREYTKDKLFKKNLKGGFPGDGILFFTEERDAEEVMKLRLAARNENKAWLSLTPDKDRVYDLASRARDWLYESGVTSLAISSDLDKTAHSLSYDILKAFLAICLLHTKPEKLNKALSFENKKPVERKGPGLSSALKDLEARLSLRDKVFLARFTGEFEILQDSALAVYILGNYLRPSNIELFEDCARKADLDSVDETQAFLVFLELFIGKMREKYLLRLVKKR